MKLLLSVLVSQSKSSKKKKRKKKKIGIWLFLDKIDCLKTLF